MGSDAVQPGQRWFWHEEPNDRVFDAIIESVVDGVVFFRMYGPGGVSRQQGPIDWFLSSHSLRETSDD